MTVKSFAESNSLGVDKVLNLCQKLGIDVESESDNLSEDDQMLLEYELEELEKANSGVAASGGGGSSSSSRKKKSDSDNDGSDFHIDNPTFSAAYKCLVDAVNMLENGLGDLSGLNQNGKDLIGSSDNDAKLYNGNLSQINELSRGLQNQMTNTIILLSRMDYKNANYFKDTLGDLLKEGKDEYWDYKSSDEYKVSQKNAKEIDDLFRKMQKENPDLTKDEFNEIINGWYNSLGSGHFTTIGEHISPVTGLSNYDEGRAIMAAKELGIYGLSMIQDTIGKLGSYNSFNLGASKYIGSIASGYGLGSLNDMSGLSNLASQCGLDNDLNILNLLKNYEDYNKKIEDMNDELDEFAKKDGYIDFADMAERKTNELDLDSYEQLDEFCKNEFGYSYGEYSYSKFLNDEKMSKYYNEQNSILTNEEVMLERFVELCSSLASVPGSTFETVSHRNAGYYFTDKDGNKQFCVNRNSIPLDALEDSVVAVSFDDALSNSTKFQELRDKIGYSIGGNINILNEVKNSISFDVDKELENLNNKFMDAKNAKEYYGSMEIKFADASNSMTNLNYLNSSNYNDNISVKDVESIESNVNSILSRASTISTLSNGFLNITSDFDLLLSSGDFDKVKDLKISDDELIDLIYASANGIGNLTFAKNGIFTSDGVFINCSGFSDDWDLGALGDQISVMTSSDSGVTKIRENDYNFFSSEEVSTAIQSIKDKADNQVVNLVNVGANGGKKTIVVSEEESKYILNAITNNTGEVIYESGEVYFINSNGMRTYVDSVDNVLSTTLREIDEMKKNGYSVSSLDKPSIWKETVVDYNYLDGLNYVYNTSSGEDRTANISNYLKTSSNQLDKRYVNIQTEIDMDYANRNPELASIKSVVLAPFEGLETAVYALEHLTNDKTVYRSQIYSTGDTYRGQVSNNIRNSGKVGAEIDAFFYDTGMSMLDNTFSGVLTGGNSLGVGVALGLSSFDNSYNDALDRGVSDGTAFLYSLSMAGLEAATEHMSFSHLKKVIGLDEISSIGKITNVDQMAEIFLKKISGNEGNYVFNKGVYNVLSQASSEGFEEYVSSVGGRFLDDIINGSLSAQNIKLNDYIAKGMSVDDAYTKIKQDNLTEDIVSILSGAVSGGGMATGGSFVSKVSNPTNYQYLDALTRADYTGDYLPAINTLLNMSDSSLSSKVLSAKITINSLYSDGKIDLESKQKLDTIVQDYHNDNYKGEFSGEINEIAKQDEFYQISLYTEMKSRLESKGVKTDKLSFEKMQKKYQDDYNTVVESLKDMEIKISTDSILYGITKSNDVDLENFKLENREMFDSELKRITEDYSDGKEKISHLIYSIVNNKIFGSDSEKVALKLINKMNNKSEITSDQTILSSLVSGIGMVGITQENLLVYMNHQDLTINDIVDDDSLSFLSEQDRNARLAQILKNYLDQMVNTTKEQNNLSSEQQLRQEHISKNMENNEDKKSIRKDSTSDEKTAMIGKGKNEGSGNDTDLKVNNNSEVVVEENKTDDNEKTSTTEISSNESTKKGQNCIRNLFSPKNSDNSIKTNRLRNKLIKKVVSTYKNIDSRLARDLLRRIDMIKSEGGTGGICGYYEVAKVIFRIFDGKEKLFKQKFGFSMYLNGDFNFEQLIVDLFVNNNDEKYVNELLGGKDVKYKALCDAVTAGKCFNLERICDYLKTKEIDINDSQFKEYQIYNSSDTDFKKMSSDDAKKVTIEIVSNVREQIKSGNQITISAMGIHSGKLEVASGKVVSNVNSIQLINVKTGESRSFSEGHVMSVRGVDSSGRLLVYTFNDLYAINLVDVLSKGNVFSINSLEIGQNILDGKSVVDQKVSVEIGPEGSLTIDDDAVMSNGEFRDSESLRGRIGLQYFGGNSNYRINSSSEYMSSISRDQLHSNLNSIVFNIINGKKRNVDTYAILVDINSTHKSVPNQQNYENFTNRFRSEDYIKNIQPGGHFYHFWSKEFNQDDVSQRLYINAEYETTFNFLELFANKCEQIGIPFYFKTAFFDYKSIFRPYIAEKTSLTRSESAVIYASNEYIVQYTNICREIKNEHPEFKFYNPPVAAASIDGWLGYGAEPNHDICVQKGVSKSFNSVRTRILDLSISKGIKNFINAYANQKFYADKIGNDILIDSLYGYLVSNYKIDNKESLYSFLISNREYFLNFLKQDVNSLTFDKHKIYANNVRMYMFENYLVNINAVYKFISDSIREISVEYGVDPDNFAINLSEQRRMQLLNNMLNDTPNDIKIITDIKYIMAAHDKKYGSGDALSRLKMFIDPSSRNYRNYGIISGNLGARNLLMKYNPQDITRYLSRFDSERMSNNNQGLSGRIGLQYFANKGKSSNLELDIVGSLTSDDAVMSNGEEDFADGFIELDDRYVVHNILINDDSVSELFNSIKESRYYNYQYKKEEVLFGLVKAFKRDSSYAEVFSERYDVSREFYNIYLANRNNLNSDQEILEFVKNYVQENTKPGSKTDLSQFSLFDIISPRNSNLYGVRQLRHSLIDKFVSKVDGVTQKFMYRILSNIESGIVLDSKYTMITGYIFNKYDGNSKEFERIFGFPMYIDGGFNKTMLVADIYSYMLSSQYEGKSVSEIFSILMDSRGKLDVVDELISNYLIDRGIIDKKQEFIYKSIFDSKTDFGDISNVNYIISNIISKISDSLSNEWKVIFSLDSTNSLYVNSLSLKNIDDKSVTKVYSGEGLTIIGVLDNNKLVVENSGGKYYIDLKDILIFGKKFNINEISFDLVSTEDRNIKMLKSNSQVIVNNKKLTIDEFYEQFNNKDFNLGGFIIKGYEILDFASDERYLDRLSKPSSNGIVYGSYSAKDMIFSLVKLFQELDKNGISANKLYPHIGKIYNEYKASARKGLLNTDNDIRMFASNYADRMGYLEGLKNNSQSKVVGMKEFGEEGNIDFQIADDFYDENIELTKEATEKLDNFMRNNGSFEDAFRVLKNAVRSKDFDSIPDSLKQQLSGLSYNQIKTYLKNKMSQIIKDDISNFDLKSFFYKKNNVADSRAYVVITDNNMIMIPSNHGSISYTLGDIFEYLDRDFDSSKYMNEAMMRRNSGYIVIELQNKFIGGRNIIYSPDVISGNQYRMLQEFNQQIKELTSKDNLASLGFNLRGNNGSSWELVNVNNIDGILSRLLEDKRVNKSDVKEIRDEMAKQQEIVEEISYKNETKVEEYNDAVMSNGEEDIDEFEDDQFRFISDDRFFSSLFDGNGKYGIDQGLFRDLRKRNHPTYIEMKNMLINKYGFSQRDAIKVMKNLDAIGACNYAAQANIIVSYFKNMPNKFQELFGFPLYKYLSNGRMYINDAEILLDLYSWYNIYSSESELFIIDKDGRTIFNKDAIKSRFGKIIMYKQRGGDNTNHNVFNEYLKSKSKDLSCVISEVSIDSLISNKKDYEVDGMTLVLGCAPSGNKPIIFEEIDTGIKYSSNGGHWTKITGVVEDGFIVSSWGKRCLVKFEDLRSNYHNIYFTKFNLENNNVLTVEEVTSNLFNIEDIRNNKKVVNMMDISKFRDNYSVDELNNILLSNRYSLSSKKAVSLALCLNSLNLDFGNIDFTYNSLIVKLFDKSLSSVDRLMIFELLRTISNEYSSFGSVQYLFDQQFIGVSESEILDLKTRNIQFDLNEFYSSNEGTVNNGATIFFTGNQVVNLLNDDHGEAGHSVTQYHIFSSIYGISLENDFASSFIYKNLESMIRVVLVSERGVSGYYIKFPSKISRKQFEMFKAYADKYGDTLSDISKGISDSGFRGLIYYSDGNYYSSESHNISDAVTFAETLIDDRYEMLDDRNIVGYTLDDLRGVDVSYDEEFNEEYDDTYDRVMSNGEEDIDDGYELDDDESLGGRIGIQYFGGKNGSNSKSMNSIFGIMNKFFNKDNTDLYDMSNVEEIISSLFNIEDIRNNNNVIDIDNIKQFESMSVDELNSILMSKRYNLSQKKAVSLVLYLKSLNLGFKTDNIDFVYNSLVYKLSDKSLSSVDKLRVFELLRTISNEFSEFDSVDELLDYQFNIPSESEILDVKTRNSKFDLNEFYSSNEFGHDNGAVIRFTDNQVVSVLNGNNGRGAHGFANENIISAIFGIEYVYQSKSFIDPFALSSSFLSSNSRNMIDVRLVSEYGYSLYSVDFPDKISRKQFELFKAYADKYGDTLRRISEDLTANNKTSGYDGLIGFIDKHNNIDVSTHDINDLVKYAETLVDDDFRLLEDRNIVGYTLDDLRGVNVSDGGEINEEYDDSYDDAVMSNGEEDVDDYRKVDVSSYVDIGIYNGTLVPFDAVKFGRIIARRGILGEEIITWSEDSNGNPIQEKPGIVGVDSETGEVDWIVTKVDENGNPIIDKNGHINEWIITDKNFKKKYEIDSKNNSVYRSTGGIQTFVKIDENIILNQWGSDMKIAKGGYINITNEDDMYGISERDFVDTYKVPDIDDYDDYSTSNEDDYKYQDDSDYEDEIYFQLEDKLYEHFHNGKFKINALGNSSNNIDLYSFNIETLVNILKNCYDDFINGTLDLGNVSYNAYRAAFYKLYEVLESSDLSDNLLSSIAFDRLRSIAFDYEDDRARMIEEVSDINGSLIIEDYDSVVLDNGIECLSDSRSSNLIDNIQRILNSVPSKLRNVTKKITLNSNNNPGESYWRFINGTDSAVDSSQTYSDEIILYKDQIDKISSDGDERIIYRELAYNFDSSMGIISNSEEWINAMKLDGNYISDYSSNDLREDFANAISNYLLDKDSFSSESSNRTKIIEQLLNDDSIGYNGENIDVNKRRSFVSKLKSKYSKLLLHLNKDIRFNEDRGIDESIKTINGYKVFSKDFDTSIKQMSKYFGDAGISDRQFGRIINMYFIRGMTVSEIKDVLNDEQLKLFNEFLETDNGKYLSKLTSDEILAIVMYTRTGDRAINKSLRTGNYTGTFSYTDEYTGKTKTITIEKFISDLNSALEKFGGIKEDTVIYRAVKLTTFTRYNSIFTRLFESIKNVDDCVEIYSVMRNLVGEKFSDLGFMSASPAYNTSYAMYDGFPVVLEILTPKGTPGSYINQISKDYNRENEFLYMNDTSLTILDVQLLHNYGDVNGVDKVVVRCVVDNNIDINEEYDDAVMSNGEEALETTHRELADLLSDNIDDENFIYDKISGLDFNEMLEVFNYMTVENIINIINEYFYVEKGLFLSDYLDSCLLLDIEVNKNVLLGILSDSDLVRLNALNEMYSNVDMSFKDNILSYISDGISFEIPFKDIVANNEFIDNNILSSFLSDISDRRIIDCINGSRNSDILSNILETVPTYRLVSILSELDNVENIISLLSVSKKRELLRFDNLSDNIRELLNARVNMIDVISNLEDINLGNGKMITIQELNDIISDDGLCIEIIDSILDGGELDLDYSKEDLLFAFVKLFQQLDMMGYILNISNDFVDFYNFVYRTDLISKDDIYIREVLNQLSIDGAFISVNTDKINQKIGVDQHAIANIFDPNSENYSYNIERQNVLIEQVINAFSGMSRQLAERFLSRIDVDEELGGTGGVCNYADVCNFIFEYFEGKEELFEQRFGFPMYIDGRLNEEQLLCDMFIKISGFELIKSVSDVNGENIIISDGKYALIDKRYNYLTNNGRMTNLLRAKYRLDLISKYLIGHGVIDDRSNIGQRQIFNTFVNDYQDMFIARQLVNNILLKVKTALEKGHHVSISSYMDKSPLELYGSIRNAKNGFYANEEIDKGGHIMTIKAIQEGLLVVDTWNETLYIDIDSSLENGVRFNINELFIDGNGDRIDLSDSIDVNEEYDDSYDVVMSNGEEDLDYYDDSMFFEDDTVMSNGEEDTIDNGYENFNLDPKKGLIKFSKNLFESIKQMSIYYGDAGLKDIDFGKKINEKFLLGMTVDEISNELSGDEKILFDEFLMSKQGIFLSKLTAEQIRALSIYSRLGAGSINEQLRIEYGNIENIYDIIESEYVNELIELIDLSIAEYGGIDADTVLYRGVSLSSFFKLNNNFSRLFIDLKKAKLQDDLVAVYAVLKSLVGEKLSDYGYMSTSPGYNTSYAMYDKYPVVLEIIAPKGTPGAYINQISSSYNKENEFLLARGTALTLNDVCLIKDINGKKKILVKCNIDFTLHDEVKIIDDRVMSNGEEGLDIYNSELTNGDETVVSYRYDDYRVNLMHVFYDFLNTFNVFLPNATSLQIARKVYNVINSYLYYNPFGIEVYNKQEKYIDLLKSMMDAQIDLEYSPLSVVCSEWASIYSQILTQLNIKNYIIKESSHAFVVFEIENEYYLADATRSYGRSKYIDLVNLKINMNSQNFFRIDEDVYDTLINKSSGADLDAQLILEIKRFADEFNGFVENEILSDDQSESIKLDRSIGEDYTGLKDSILRFKNASKKELSVASESKLNLKQKTELRENMLEKYVFPELVKIEHDMLTSLYWLRNIVKSAFDIDIRSVVLYNSKNGQNALIFKIEKSKKYYIYREGSGIVEKVKSIDIQNEGYDFNPTLL